jgi:hypothetical protein
MKRTLAGTWPSCSARPLGSTFCSSSVTGRALVTIAVTSPAFACSISCSSSRSTRPALIPLKNTSIRRRCRCSSRASDELVGSSDRQRRYLTSQLWASPLQPLQTGKRPSKSYPSASPMATAPEVHLLGMRWVFECLDLKKVETTSKGKTPPQGERFSLSRTLQQMANSDDRSK